MEAVTGVLVERAAAVRGLPRMVTLSAVGHVVMAAGLILWSTLVKPAPDDRVRPVMTISLGGVPGPQAGGMTMMGRPIQAAEPLPEARRPEPLRPPAAKPPAMVLPDPKARPARTPPKPAPAASARAASPAPARSAAPPTPDPNRGMGFGGLSTGGGGGAGGYLDVKDFCCPDYLVTMLQVVQRNWHSRQEVGGETLVKFRIQRDGRITDIELEKSSGYAALDLTAQRALFLTQRVPPLPSAFPDDQLTVHLRFEYHR